MKKRIKIKDLPENLTLDGKVLCIPAYARKNRTELLPKMIIRSGWNKGFWCVKEINASQIFPVFFKDFKEVKEWSIEVNPIELKDMVYE